MADEETGLTVAAREGTQRPRPIARQLKKAALASMHHTAEQTRTRRLLAGPQSLRPLRRVDAGLKPLRREPLGQTQPAERIKVDAPRSASSQSSLAALCRCRGTPPVRTWPVR